VHLDTAPDANLLVMGTIIVSLFPGGILVPALRDSSTPGYLLATLRVA